MRFIDEAIVKISAGNGGDGCISFRREKYVSRGGPDGGNGGYGGNVIIVADCNLGTLFDFCCKNHFLAGNGEKGKSGNRTGKKGNDIYIKVPIGTLVFNYITKEIIGDLIHNKQRLLIARGGSRGLGNTYFKSSVNRTPKHYTKGGEGESLLIRLELLLLADVGVIGLPNAGKSTFVSLVSSCKTKIGSYPFTTLFPKLGVVQVNNDNSFIIADIPGIIKNSYKGIGLGIRFLKHLKRCYMLLHFVDLFPLDNSDPVNNINIIFNELKNSGLNLDNKECWLIFNKIDLVGKNKKIMVCINRILNHLKWIGKYYFISSFYKCTNVNSLCFDIMNFLKKKRKNDI